ncbi:MAG: hypothetical protein AAFY06_13335, partial [Pseudomonadota bacterium]
LLPQTAPTSASRTKLAPQDCPLSLLKLERSAAKGRYETKIPNAAACADGGFAHAFHLYTLYA